MVFVKTPLGKLLICEANRFFASSFIALCAHANLKRQQCCAAQSIVIDNS